MTGIGRRSFKALVDLITALSLVAIAAALWWGRPMQVLNGPGAAPSVNANRGATSPVIPLPKDPVSIEGAWTQGDKSAPVVLVEYSDFQCPYCARFVHDTLPDLKKRYIDTGKVLLVFRHFPLEQIHPFALNAATAAECAGQQGRFWEMHDRLFAEGQGLDKPTLERLATGLQLNAAAFQKCLDGDFGKRIRQVAQGGRVLAVSGTPTFFIGTRRGDGRVDVKQRFAGAVSSDQFDRIVQTLLPLKITSAR